MIWKTPNNEFTVELPSEVLSKMSEHVKSDTGLETGGILIGKYIDANTIAVVYDACPPPADSTCTFSTFKRGVKGLSKLLKSLWYQRERLYYIGEWHYHPVTKVCPSHTDFSQMISISEDPNYECKEPIMVIIGKGENEKRELKCLVFPKGVTLEMYEVNPL